jgi:hypothetical protein
MTEQQYVIDLGPEGRGIVDAEEVPWLHEKLREPGSTRVRIRATDDDTEGHGATGTLVRVLVEDDDDTEGHAIAIHFPSREEADAFRRRLLVTGVLVGSVALGAVGGVGLANLSQDGQAGSVGGTVVQTQVGPMDAHEAPAFDSQLRADQAWSDRLNAQAAAAQAGPMDAHEAPAFDSRAQADQAWSDRLNAQAEAQAGPMDAHEAPAFQEGTSAADQAWSDRLNAQAAAAQTGPMDAHEAPAFQASAPATDADRDIGLVDGSNLSATQTGPMDAHEAPAFQDGAAAADETEVEGLGGPQPR